MDENRFFNIGTQGPGAAKAVLHYLRYDTKQGSTVAVFDETDFEDIISSHKLFVRKLSAEKSEKLVRMLDAARLG